MDILFPQLPKTSADGTFKASEVEAYNKNIQEVIKKVANNTSSGNSSSGVGADIIIKYEIEALITHWCLVDPTQLPAVYQICDGSVWKAGSYAETFWTPKGLTKIPNLCGYGLRSADRSSTQNDPDRDDRRQAVTGQVLTGGTTVSLPAFYCNVIKEARDKGRTVQIGINTTDMFGTLSPVGTVSSVDLINNTVTVGTALTVGTTALIIRGDCIGSFQMDQFGSHRHSYTTNNAPQLNFSIGSQPPRTDDTNGSQAYTHYTGGNETRIKNISYLPIMYVLLPSQALVNINGEIRNIDALIDKIGANSYISQIVQNHVTDPYSYASGGTLASPRELTCLNTSITTVKKESKIAIDVHICMETINNSVLELYRVVDGVETKIGSPQQAGSRYFGITIVPFDNNQDSTMSNVEIQYIDTPSCDIGKVITYKIKIYGETGTGYFINRTLTDSDSVIFERATSNVRLTEFAGTPSINFGDTDVASVTEAKAGVNNTKVITPYGLRQALNAEGSAPVYACRAWVCFDASSGTPIIRGSGNVSSITDRGVGRYTVNFITSMPDTNYSMFGSIIGATTPYAAIAIVGNDTETLPTISSCPITIFTNGNYTDFNRINLSIFR